MMQLNSNPSYLRTNESLYSIVNFLKPCPKDDILTIGGSGDQAFAFLEKGAKVSVVDKNQNQIDYIHQRINFLDGNLIGDFLQNVPDEYEYFKQHHFKKIKKNLTKLFILEPQDIFLMNKKDLKQFNKIYLSNVLGRINESSDIQMRILSQFSEKLQKNALIYLSSRIYEYPINRGYDRIRIKRKMKDNLEIWNYILLEVNNDSGSYLG